MVPLLAAASWGADIEPPLNWPGILPPETYFDGNMQAQILYRVDLIRYTAQKEALECDLHRQREIFCLQAIAVASSFLLGLSFFACFMAARKSRLP